MVRNYGLARHYCACYILLPIQLTSAGWRPKSHLFPHTWISLIVPLALKAPLWLKLMPPVPKVLVQPQIFGRVSVGSFPPHGHPRAEDSCSPQGPGPHLSFLAKHGVTVGCAQRAQLDTKLSVMRKVSFFHRKSASLSETCPLHQNPARLFRIGLSWSKAC